MTLYARKTLPVAIVVIMVVFAGCGTTANFRNAQNYFNKGAELELRQMATNSVLVNDTTTGAMSAASAVNEYRLAYEEIKTLIDENSEKLSQNRLLGAAYILKAMSLWRLSAIDIPAIEEGEKPSLPTVKKEPSTSEDSKKPSTEAENYRSELLDVLLKIEKLKGDKKKQIKLGTRDNVLSKALFGFYDLNGAQAENDYEKAKKWYKNAYKALNDALNDGVPKNHRIRLYIGICKLRALGLWNIAVEDQIDNEGCDIEENKETCRTLSNIENQINTCALSTYCSLENFWKYEENTKKLLKREVIRFGKVTEITASCPVSVLECPLTQ